MKNEEKKRTVRSSYHPASRGAVPGMRKKNVPARRPAAAVTYGGAGKALRTLTDFWSFCFRRWSGLS